MESGEPKEVPPISVSPPIEIEKSTDTEIPIEIPVETPQQIARKLLIGKKRAKAERMRLVGIANRRLLDSKVKINIEKSSAVGGNSSSSTGTVPVPVEKPAVPTMVEFACDDESELGK